MEVRTISESLGAIYSSINLKLDGFESNMNKAIRQFSKLNNATNNTGKQFNNFDKATNDTSKQFLNLDKAANNTGKQLLDLDKAATNTSKQFLDLDKAASNASKSIGQSLIDAGDKISKTGESVSSFGNKLTLGVTTPLIAGGTAITKFAMDMEDGVTKVTTVADMSKISIEGITKGVTDLSNQTGISTKELNEALYNTISAGVDTSDAISFLTDSTKLAKAGFADIGNTIDVLTTIMNSYGMEASDLTKISDMLIQSQNLGKLTVNELSTALGRVIPTAKAAGVKIDQLSAAYVEMTKAGVSVQESTTYINAMFNELNKSGTKVDKILKQISKKSFKQLMESGKSVGDILAMLDEHAKKNKLSLGDLFGSSEAAKAAMILAEDAGSKFNDTLGKLNQSAGSTEQAFDKVSNTTQEKFKRALNEAKNSAMELGTKLLPLVEKGLDFFNKLLDKFNSLSPAMQDNIIKYGLMAAAIGPAISAVGGLIQGVGGLVGTIGKVGSFFGLFSAGATAATTTTTAAGAAAVGGATGFGALAGGLGAALAAAGPWILGAVAVAGAGYGIYKVLDQEVIPSVDLFADSLTVTGTTMTAYGELVTTETIKISEATQQAVGAYIAMDEGVTNSLFNMYITSEVVTAETCNTLMTKYQEMGQTITAGLQQDKSNDLGIMTQFFADTTVLTDTSEALILEKINGYYNARETETKGMTEKIKQILQTAANEQRSLKESEVKEISQLQNQMKTQAIKTLSTQEKEANVILDRLASYDKRVTADMASEHIQTLNQQKDKAIDAANSEYREKESVFNRMADELKVISREQADELIREAERQKDETIRAANDTRNGAVDKIFSMNSDLQNNVDSTTGKIISTWDRLFGTWDRWKPSSKEFTITTNEVTNKITNNIENDNAKANSGIFSSPAGRAVVHDSKSYGGYGEVMDLPGGTRIYPHDVSMKMAEEVARNVVEKILGNKEGANTNITQNIYSPEPLTPSEIARQTLNAQKELTLGLI